MTDEQHMWEPTEPLPGETTGKWRRRKVDQGPLCWIALRAAELWDWIDKRDIDKHMVAMVILFGTTKVLSWAMHFAETHERLSGLEMAAILGAVLAPYMALQGAAIKFYFDSRDKP